MILKTYIVNDMQEGMEKIKKELGPDAIILSTKEYKKKGIKGLFSKPKTEIVAAYDSQDRISIQPRETQKKIPAKTSQGRERTKNSLHNDAEISAIESKLSKLDNTLNSFMQRIENNYADKFASYSKPVRSFAGNLLDSDVREDIVYKLCDKAEELIRKSGGSADSAIEKVVKDYLGKAKVINPNKKNQVILFLGATGVGKTTTLSKIATDMAVNRHKKTAVMTTDIYKIASTEQLKVYTDILEVPFSVVYSNEDIDESMNKFADCDIIFIDTGKSPDEEEYNLQIRDLISRVKPDEIYLVMSAGSNYKSCVKTLSGYSYLKDYRIIITKTDEAESPGMIFNIRSLTDKPFSYLTYGQILTEDIKEFNSMEIIRDLKSNSGKE